MCICCYKAADSKDYICKESWNDKGSNSERNVKGYQLYEYMWQTKKFKLVGKIEGKKYYKYDSKKKKFTRDRKSKVVQNAKKKTISVKITTNNVNFKRYRRYRFKVRSYVKYNGKQIFSKLSKQKIVR